MKSFLLIALLSFVWDSVPPVYTLKVDTIASEPENMKGMVERHNFWRAKVRVNQLKWSDELAIYAQVWADHLAEMGCDMQHRPWTGEFSQKYGENIYWCSGMRATPEIVVDSWASELADFNPKRGECDKGKVCGHYTQIVWSSTQKVGCAVARCENQEIWVCNYNPPGNWVGQKPYSIK